MLLLLIQGKMEWMTEDDINMILKRSKKEQGKPVPKEITTRQNAKMIVKLIENYSAPISVINDIFNYKQIDEFLKDKSDSTKRNYYGVLRDLAFYEKFVNQRDNQDILDYFYKKVGELQKDIQQKEQKGEMSQTKTIKMEISDADIETLLHSLKENGHKREYVIFSILNQYPIRAEIANFVLIGLKDYNKKKKDGTLGDGNFLINGTRKIAMSRGDFKTSPIYGRIETELTGTAKKVVKEYLKSENITEGQSVFGFSSNEELAKRLTYISGKYLKTTSLSVNSLAKLVIKRNITALHKSENFKNALPVEQTQMDKSLMEKLAEIRGTSLQTFMNSYLRN